VALAASGRGGRPRPSEGHARAGGELQRRHPAVGEGDDNNEMQWQGLVTEPTWTAPLESIATAYAAVVMSRLAHCYRPRILHRPKDRNTLQH
jgi:hypothetical protein